MPIVTQRNFQSAQFTRPPYGTFRAHVPEDSLTVEERARRQRATGKFPTKDGYHEPAAFIDNDSEQYKRFEDEGDMRVGAPLRSDDPVIDPTSGFTSVALDAVNGNWKTLEPLVNKDNDPRPATSAPFGRPITFRNPVPGVRTMNAPWEERNKGLKEHHSANDCLQFSNAKDARNVMKKSVEANPGDLLNNKHWRDAVATRAFYTSSTQRLYDGVDWAAKLPLPWNLLTQLWSYDQTECSIDSMISIVMRNLHKFGSNLEADLTPGIIFNQEMAIEFMEELLIAVQIEMLKHNNYLATCEGEVDDPKTSYAPVTLVRNGQPRYSDTARKGNIPGYSGCLLWATNHTAHSLEPQPKQASTHRTYRSLQYPPNSSPFKKQAPFGNMVTTVPPCNPFSKFKKHYTETYVAIK